MADLVSGATCHGAGRRLPERMHHKLPAGLVATTQGKAHSYSRRTRGEHLCQSAASHLVPGPLELAGFPGANRPGCGCGSPHASPATMASLGGAASHPCARRPSPHGKDSLPRSWDRWASSSLRRVWSRSRKVWQIPTPRSLPKTGTLSSFASPPVKTRHTAVLHGLCQLPW